MNTDYDNDEILKRYLKDIKTLSSLIDPDEEKRLAKIIQDKKSTVEDKMKAKDRLVLANLRLVVKLAMDFYNKIHYCSRDFNVSVMDLIQAGNIGLMRAADLFEGERGVKFVSYAYFSIERHIKKTFKESRFIQIPMNSYSTLIRLREIDDNEEKTDKEIRKELEVGQGMLNALRLNKNPVISLDEMQKSDLVETIASDDAPLVDILSAREVNDYLFAKINELTPMEKWTIFYRFLNNQPLTLDEIGRKFGVTRERIRIAEAKALHHLRAKIEEERKVKTLMKGENNEYANGKGKRKYRSKYAKSSLFFKKLYRR